MMCIVINNVVYFLISEKILNHLQGAAIGLRLIYILF